MGSELAVAIGLITTIIPGLAVGWLVGKVRDSIPLPPPGEELKEEWKTFVQHNTGGGWIGFFERLLFFAALYVESGWPILSTWIAMKTAFYWQGTNFGALPSDTPKKEDFPYIIARHQLGNNRVATALVGTAANILLGLAGAAVAKALNASPSLFV